LFIGILFSIVACLFIYFTIGLSKLNSIMGNNIDTSTIIKQIKPSIVTIKIVESSTGSGIVVTEDGFIVTNAHVMKEKSAVAIFSDGSRTEAQLVMLDEENDFVLVIATVEKDYQFLTLGDSNKCSEGDTVISAGAPLSLEFSFTKGIVSSTNRMLPFLRARLIQTNAANNPGNRVGPLNNSNGEVIGINFLKLVNLSAEGIGFAIAINGVKNHIKKKQQMSDMELTKAIARENKKLVEYNLIPNNDEMNKMKDRALEEQWEGGGRRREFNEKVETANRDLQEQKERAEKRLQEEAEQLRRRQQESAEARRRSLSDCLQSATNRYQGIWNDYCKIMNQQDNCALSSNIAGVLEQRQGQLLNECYRLNPL
jgi:hypothetical protein